MLDQHVHDLIAHTAHFLGRHRQRGGRSGADRRDARRAASEALSEQINAKLRDPPLIE